MSTFDPKKKKGFAGEDRRGDRFGNYSRRDDSRSFDHDGDPSPFVKDKRPRISRPARDVRSGSDGPFGDGGKRHSFNPNFTKDNRRRDEFPGKNPIVGSTAGNGRGIGKMSPRNVPTIGMNGTTARRGGANRPMPTPVLSRTAAVRRPRRSHGTGTIVAARKTGIRPGTDTAIRVATSATDRKSREQDIRIVTAGRAATRDSTLRSRRGRFV